MAEIRNYWLIRHLRSEPTQHLLFWKDGRKARSGRGLSFWFTPLGASVAEIPLEDREIPFLFHARTRDFQDVAVNGVVTFRVSDAERLASRVDFAIDTRTGLYRRDPLDTIALVVTQLAQQLAAAFLGQAPLRGLLEQGVEGIRQAVHDGLIGDDTLVDLGIQVAGTRVASLAPTSEMEKALEMPTREKIQQTADEATFERRALAVDKERAIQENELANQIELARREETLIGQRGQNERRRATEAVESARIAAEGQAETVRLGSDAQAQSIRVLEEAKVAAEGARMDIYKTLPSAALFGLAARELAGKLHSIEHLNLSPDLLGPLLQRVLGAGAKKLESET